MARRRIRSVLLAAVAAVALSPALATAQAYDDAVVIDYSQIGGGAAAPGAAMPGGSGYAAPGYGSGLRMPGLAAPPSRFYPPAGLPAVSASDEAPPAPRAKFVAKPKEPVEMPAEAPAPSPRKERKVAAKPAAPVIDLPSAPPAEPVLPKKPEAPAVAPPAPPAPPAIKKSEPPKAPEVAKVEAPKATPKSPETPAAEPTSGAVAYKVVFAGDAAAVPSNARESLKAVADRVNATEEQRIQLAAYASGANMSPSSARRLSLSRALAVRSFLIDAGVRSVRIDVRAMGDKIAGDPANRVDVTIVDR